MNRGPRHRRHARRGFTLVELMVGLAVGLFIALASISVFVSSRIMQTVGSAESRMVENARLAMDLLHKDFRSAGFQGCNAALAGPPLSVLNANNGIFLDAASTGLGGFHGGGVAFTPALNATLAALPKPPDAHSDVVSIRVPVEPMSLGLAAPMTATTGDPNVGTATAGNNIVSGDIVLIASCKAGAMFQVTAASPGATGVLSHAVGGAAQPGNASNDLGQIFRSDAAVYRLQTHHYYVAPSVLRSGTNSLWRYTFPTTDGSPAAQEIVEGVDRLLVTYGVDDGTGSKIVSRYVDAGGVGAWDSVITARMQILMATVKDNIALHAQPASFAGGTVTPTDRRLRTQFTEVIALRSRAP